MFEYMVFTVSVMVNGILVYDYEVCIVIVMVNGMFVYSVTV